MNVTQSTIYLQRGPGRIQDFAKGGSSSSFVFEFELFLSQ